ncbi:glycosyltransferase [Bacillus sp. JJ1533]|uniref:glycosyltransferase family 2 protein n=1 Tax=Bacillus sp. JJ1533 TaxID=3122959 RepID=UPI002FFEC77F
MSSWNPLISIVIPTFNRGNIIKETIFSVIEQTYKNIEIIIIDDASTDDTEKVINDIYDRRIKYVKLNKNTSGTKPRNLGISISKGEYIAFLDSDDLWLPNKLERQIRFIEDSKLSNKPVMFFTGLIIRNGKTEVYKINNNYSNEDIMDYILVGNNTVQTSTYLVSSSIAKETLFNKNLKKHQDWDFCLRLQKNNVTFTYLPECLTIWNVDIKNNRLSNSYKNEDISLVWFNQNKKYLSLKAQLAFKTIILVDRYINERKKIKATELALNAFIHRSINVSVLTKTLVKIYFPIGLQNGMKNLYMKIFIKI